MSQVTGQCGSNKWGQRLLHGLLLIAVKFEALTHDTHNALYYGCQSYAPFYHDSAFRIPVSDSVAVWPRGMDNWYLRLHLCLIICRAHCRGAFLNFMASSSGGGGGFDLFEALCSQPDLLELVVQQCSGRKNDLRLACSRLRAAVDACVTGLEWTTSASQLARLYHLPFTGPNHCAENIAVLARFPRLLALDFNKQRVDNLSPLAACTGLRRITRICAGDDVTPLAALTQLEHLDCSQSDGLSDISALSACTALKYLDCSRTWMQQLPPLPASLETLICRYTPLSDISALAACMALKHLDLRNNRITILPPLPASLETLQISGNLIKDLLPLTECIGLRTLECGDARVHDLSPLAACAGLRSLDCNHTMVQDLRPLAACAELRSLDCRFTLIRNLMPLLACTWLEVLKCDSFDGVVDQTNQLLQVRPDLDIIINELDDEDDGEEDEDEDEDGWDEEGEDDGEGNGVGTDDWDAQEYEMEGHGLVDSEDEGGTDDNE